MLWDHQIRWSIVTPRISSCLTVAVKPLPGMVLNDDSVESKDLISPKNRIFRVLMMSATIARGPIVDQLDLIQGCLVSKIVVLPYV